MVLMERVSVHCARARLEVVATSTKAKAVKSRNVFIDRGFAANLTKTPCKPFTCMGLEVEGFFNNQRAPSIT